MPWSSIWTILVRPCRLLKEISMKWWTLAIRWSLKRISMRRLKYTRVLTSTLRTDLPSLRKASSRLLICFKRRLGSQKLKRPELQLEIRVVPTWHWSQMIKIKVFGLRVQVQTKVLWSRINNQPQINLNLYRKRRLRQRSQELWLDSSASSLKLVRPQLRKWIQTRRRRRWSLVPR